ncbi:aspartyl-phosphate phosphatase Spo0E family protein [Ornithinibacillus californiensis]|uniref:aspartyl-phosphate phosphatase Spo0E family protein n=1 Tax=Ornithinibacillus californiensis TaxID=161536 RepID=UPI00064D744D|nr:aspartyl-phosphate phosphatase Spo0E family protein [Ornithinibacillus californiensis]
MHDTDKLLKEIETLRSKMSSTALTQGITSLESIALSQELDRLLNIYEKSKKDHTHSDIEEIKLK